MSGLFGGGKKATSHATRAMGIDFQGAQYGPVIPVVYGRNKVPGNCIWYGDFQSHAQQQKAGKGGGGGSTTNYTYSASAQMGLCEGPGIGLRTVYDGTSVVNLSSINYAFASGAIGQAPWSHLSGSAALGYSLTAIFSFQNLDLGSQASLPNYNYELDALKQFSGSIPDANPKDILSDICSDPYHGVNFPYLGDLTQYSNYCVANGLFLSPVYDQQQSANQALSDLFKYTNTYAYYSEDQLKVVPLGDTAVTANGATFTPNVTPVVNLGTDDFIPDGEGGSSISIDRKAPQDNLNLVRVEFKDRANTYHDSAVVAAIDEDIITNGGRSDDSETVNGCTTAAVARFIAQNLVQRAFYIRNTYQFKLSWRYCYLEPTDIVTLTDASLGLNLYPVRITEIEEDGDSALTITAEEFPEGIGHSAIYNTQPNGGTNIDQNADPGAANPPFLFRGPGFLVTGSNPEIWCAVNGSDPMWAGCEVYLSHDGTSYTFAGTVASQARYGSLTAALAAGTADPDITNTPTVQVYAPGELLGGSQTDADNFVTLAMIDSEIIAYETATLQAANTYKLSYLRRGGYGSANVAHNAGAPFVRLDDSIFRIPVDPSLIGSTVYLKFLSINAFGRTPRTLAEETAYTYVVGTNVELPDVPNAPDTFAVAAVADGVQITWINDNPAAVGCTSIEYATASAGPFTVLAQVGPTTTGFHHAFTTGSTYYYRARARGPLVQSGWSAYTGVLSSAGKTVQNGATNGATIGPGGNVNGAVDGNGRALVDATQTGHIGAWNLDSRVADGTNFQRVGTGYADGSGRIVNLWDGTAIRSATNTWDGANRARTGLQSSGVLVAGLHPVDNLIDGTNFVRHAALGSSDTAVVIQNPQFALGPDASTGDTFVGWQQTNGYLYDAGTPEGPYTARVMTLRSQGPSTRARAIERQFHQCRPGDLLHLEAYLANASGDSNAMAVQAFYYGPTGAFITGGGARTTTSSTYGWIGGDDAVPAGATQYKITIYKDPDANAGTYSYGKCADVRAYINDVRKPNGKKAYIDFSDNTAGGHAGKHLGNIGDDTGSNRYAVFAIDANRRPYVDLTQTGHIGKNLGNMADDATSHRYAVASDDIYPSGGYNRIGLRVAGSGQQIGDLRNVPPSFSAGPVSNWRNLTISYTATTGSPATATISVSAAQIIGLLAAGGTLSYNASSASVSGTGGTNVTYYLYYNDPTFAGGTQTLNASTNANDPYTLGHVYVGTVTVAFPTSGSGSGGGGGGLCVGAEMWLRDGLRAGDAVVGDVCDCLDLPTEAGKHQRALLGVEHHIGPRIRLITDKGAAWIGGLDTTFDLPDGRITVATRMIGEQVVTDWGVETVVSAALTGDGPLCRNHFGGVSYAAGADAHHRIYSHNTGTQKP